MKLKAGIIGLGVGEAHIKGYNEHPDSEVIALCDIAEDKLAMAKEKYTNIQITDNASDVLNNPEINVVSIASYDGDHYSHIVEAIKNDKHIFVEKPLCLYEKEAQHIRELLSKKPHLKISSNLILRKCPRFIHLKELIESKKMGDLFYVEGDYDYGRIHKITEGWRGKVDFYSVVYGGGVHIIDLLLWLTGDNVEEVAAYGNNIASKGSQFRYNDMVSCVLKFKSGMIGKISANFGCVRPHFHGLEIYGTKSTFINGQEYGILYESRDPSASPKKISQSYPGVHKSDFIHGFVDSITKDTEPEISKEDVFRSMSICFAIEKAVNAGKAVRVHYI